MSQQKSGEALKLKSHVGRDLLSSAAAFKTDASVVWEYVANSIQYVDPGTVPRVRVLVSPKGHTIEVHDNGRGMGEVELQHFFTLHGENVDRKRGRPGRGKFGTGKSAAFGIARTLRIVTRRNGLLNEVVLHRKDVDSSDGSDIPVSWVQRAVSTQEANGTSVLIEDVFVQDVKRHRIQEYIERHLAAFRGVSPSVAVNEHICEARVPDRKESFNFHPTESQQKLLGDVTLTIHVSPVPLDPEHTGIAITAGSGNLVAVEDCGVAAKEYGNYLFGDIDVPALETFDAPIEAYDDSRSLKLNQNHPVVRAMIPFIAGNLEFVRKELARQNREAKKSEEARRLAQTADKIAEVLNKDFISQKDRLADIRSATASNATSTARFGRAPKGAGDESEWQAGHDELGNVEKSDRSPNTGDGKGREPPKIRPSGAKNPDGSDSVSPAGGKGPRPAARGGFTVGYEALGRDSERSKFDIGTLKILINLEHPAVSAAMDIGGVEDIAFKRLSYEIAFTEYALGLAYVLVQQDEDYPASDALYDIRETLRRVAAAAANLYRT